MPEPRSRTGVLIRVAIVVVLLAVCAAIGMSLLQRTRAADAAADRAARTYSPPPVSVAQPALVSVISDQTSGAVPGSAEARTAPKPWISDVSSSISVRIAPFIVPASGYAETGTSTANGGSTFGTRAADVSASSRVIVFIGGDADRSTSSLTEIKAATRALAAAGGAAPDARLVVVAPVTESGSTDQDLAALRDVLHSAARVADATWIDPVERGWLTRADYWSSDDVLTAAGQKELGKRMTAVLRQQFKDGA